MLMDIIKARHSIRRYTQEQISKDDLEKILEAGNFVSKEQPSTIDDPTIKNGFYDAPTVVCVFCQDNFLFKTADAFCMMENRIGERNIKMTVDVFYTLSTVIFVI